MVSVNKIEHDIDKFNDPEWGSHQLRSISIFREFTQEELMEIYGRGEIRQLNPSAHAVIEGEASRGVYIILSGTVSVYKNDPSTGSVHRLARLEKGTSFGELSLFDSAPRSATVSADTTCYLFQLDAPSFEAYLDVSGDNAKARFYKKCAEDMSERFRILNSDYINSQQLLWKYALRRENPKTKPAQDSESVDLDFGSDD